MRASRDRSLSSGPMRIPSDIQTAAVCGRTLRRSTWIAMLLCGCAVVPEAGWQADLERRIGDPGALPIVTSTLANAAGEDVATGDAVVLGVTLETGGLTKEWRVEVEVGAIAEQRVHELGSTQTFEQRVLPSEARQRQIAEANAKFRAQLADPAFDFDDLAHEAPVAGIRVEAFDAGGTSVGVGESSAIVSQLRRGLLPACRAGHRQRELMRDRVAAGLDAPVITVDDDAYDDIKVVSEGVAACARLFRLLRQNPVLKQILREVLALPSLWSILTNWGVRITFSVDFFAAERVDPARFPGEQRELWSVPMMVLLNGQPGFLARVIVGPSGSPDGAVAGVYGIVARHPTDADRRVQVRLLSSRRGAPVPAEPIGN